MTSGLPSPFFDVVIHDLGRRPGLDGLSVGYERGEWRYEPLAEYLFSWLPNFALSPAEAAQIDQFNAWTFLRRAALNVYTSPKSERRGEFGELLLHAAIRQVHGTEPAVSKVFFKDSANDTVKGFDCVHVLPLPDGELELWLGEVKFYGGSPQRAVTAVVAELEDHLATDYLRREFALITKGADPCWAA